MRIDDPVRDLTCLPIQYGLELESWVKDALVWVPMMYVGIVGVYVYQRHVNVRVTVRFVAVPSS
jgi:hypothetical protein